jgi:hypothetical protein
MSASGLQPSRNDPLPGRVIDMARKLVIELPDGSRKMLENVPAKHELQLQEKLKQAGDVAGRGGQQGVGSDSR